MTVYANERERKASLSSSKPLLALKNVSFTMEGRVVLHPLTLDLAPRKSIALIGHAGSGKSTLLKLIARQHAPSSGTIHFEDKPLASWPALGLVRRLAYLPQRTAAAPGMLVRELVQRGRHPWHGTLGRFSATDRKKVDEAIELTGIGAYSDRMVDNLSGSERQRVWLAMLVAQDAACLLLDELPSALDGGDQPEVLSLTRDLCREKGMAIVTVLDDVTMAARFCDEIIALHSGRLIASGTPEQVMTPEELARIADMRKQPTSGRVGPLVQ